MARSWTSTFDTEAVRAALADAVPEGLEQAAAHVLADSQRRVPFINGDLSRSADSGLVGPSCAAMTYRDRGAVDAHERTDVPAANGRERKFLESAMNSTSTRTEAAEIIAAAIRRRF